MYGRFEIRSSVPSDPYIASGASRLIVNARTSSSPCT
jgi:hypothetical protein